VRVRLYIDERLYTPNHETEEISGRKRRIGESQALAEAKSKPITFLRSPPSSLYSPNQVRDFDPQHAFLSNLCVFIIIIIVNSVSGIC
jgi:hypothetical protein